MKPPNGTHWQLICRSCDASKVRIDDPDDDSSHVSCGLCGVALGTWGEVKVMVQKAMVGFTGPDVKVLARRVEMKR